MASQPVGISASRGAAILGLSEYMTQFEAWQLLCEEFIPGFNARRGYVLPERKDSAPLRWGKAFEDAIVALAEEREGRPIVDREQLFFSTGHFKRLPTAPSGLGLYISCHIDGRFDGLEVIHEGKTTSPFPFREKWGEEGSDRVPQSYQVQGQHEFICTGAEREILSLLVFPETQDALEKLGWLPGLTSSDGWWLFKGEDVDEPFTPCMNWARVFAQIGNFHTYYLEPKPDLGSLLVDAYRHFWDHHVIAGIEPEIKTYDDVKRAFPEPKGTLVCPPEIAALFAEMKAITEEIGEGGSLKKRKEELQVLALNWARKQDATVDDDSRSATIFRDEKGDKLGQFAKNKNGVLAFRAA